MRAVAIERHRIEERRRFLLLTTIRIFALVVPAIHQQPHRPGITVVEGLHAAQQVCDQCRAGAHRALALLQAGAIPSR